jgi:outer membrane protein OmpA-like peptidoglycan-associated protein
MKPKIFHSLRVTSVVATALLAAACASNDTSDPLAQATQTFKMANSSPAVRQHAPAELNLARNALSSARTAVKEKADGDEIVHRAYVAEQRAKIALNRGNARASQKQIVQLGERREQLMLAAQSQKALTAQQRLQAQLSELSTKHNARGLVVTLGDILFDSNGTTLKPGGHKQVGRLAEVLQTAPDRKVIVEGHTDSLGTDEYNLNLSQQRADVVRQELIAKGVDKARVGSTGLGESTPVATNETSAGRQQNRRVEIIIENPKQAAR